MRSAVPDPMPSQHTKQRHNDRQSRKDNGVGGLRKTSNGIAEAVILAAKVEYPIYSGKLALFDNYEFFEKKGEGAFGKVMVVRHLRTGLMRACKCIQIKNKDQMKLINTEIDLMQKLDHPNILRIFESYHDDDTQVFLITELCNGSSLFDRLIFHERNLRTPMTEAQSADYTKQILQAIR